MAGGEELENRAADDLRVAREAVRHSSGARRQIEVTGGDRVWHLLDVAKRTVWVDYTGAHPKATE